MPRVAGCANVDRIAYLLHEVNPTWRLPDLVTAMNVVVDQTTHGVAFRMGEDWLDDVSQADTNSAHALTLTLGAGVSTLTLVK